LKPALRLRSLSKLANPGKPVMSLHTKGKAGTCPTDKTVKEKEGGGRQPMR